MTQIPKNNIEYQFDIFLSWTGCDRVLKDQIRQHFVAKGLRVYDSDLECRGDYRISYDEALHVSKVYLMILTDGLLEHPSSEVTGELNIAKECEAEGILNILVLCLSDSFKYDNIPTHFMQRYLHSHTVGYSFNNTRVDENGLLSDSALLKLEEDCKHFVTKRDQGAPVMSKAPIIDLDAYSAPYGEYTDNSFYGRTREIDEICKKFYGGAQIVVLRGMGGIGKSRLAVHIAKLMHAQNELDYVQTVSLNDSDICRDNGIENWVEEITLKKSIADNIAGYDRKRRYQRHLSALKELPQYCLLVIDNFNALDRDAIRFIEELKCRVIITTRKALDERDFESDNKVSFFDLDKKYKINIEEAYDMFVKESYTKVDKFKFKELYQLTSGHTYAICFIAKILASKNKNMDEVISAIKSGTIGDINDADGDNLNKLFTKLYDLSDIDEDSLIALRYMSLLADRSIDEDTLCSLMGKDNRNITMRLVNNCWLFRDGEKIKIHPMISQLIFDNQELTQDNCRPIIEYLIASSEADKNLSLKSINHIANALYFALDRLASKSGELCVDLWKRFEDVKFLMGDVDDINNKVAELRDKLHSEEEKSYLIAYLNKVHLELQPVTYIDTAKEMVKALSQNGADYQRALAYMSTMSLHLLAQNERKEIFEDMLVDMLKAAQTKKDDLAVFNLFVYLAYIDHKKSTKIATSYLKKRKADGVKNGTLAYLKQSNITVQILGQNFLEQSVSILKNLAEDEYKSLYKMILRHPILFFKSMTSMHSWEKLPDDDPMKGALCCISNVATVMANENYIDIPEFFEAIKQIYILNYQRGFTKVSISDIVKNFVNIVKQLPKQMQGELSKIANITMRVDDFYRDDIDIEKIAYLDVAQEINAQLHNWSAITQSKTLVEVNKKYYPPSHTRVILSTLQYANTLTLFGQRQQAIDAYLEVYEVLKANIKESMQLGEVCYSLLSIGESMSIDKLEEIRDTALGIFKDKNWNRCSIVCAFADALIKKCKIIGGVDCASYTLVAMDEVFALCRDIAAYPKNCHVNMVNIFRNLKINLFNIGSIIMSKELRKEYSQKAIDTFKIMSKNTSGRAGRNASLFYTESKAFKEWNCYEGSTVEIVFSDSAMKLMYSLINKCIKMSTDVAGIIGNCARWYKLSRYNQFKGQVDLSGFIDSLIGAKGKRRQSIATLLDGFKHKVKQGNPSMSDKECQLVIMRFIENYQLKVETLELRKLKSAKDYFATLIEKALSLKGN